jgi:eukaryotic-like serine/threonine-protein kinase
VIDSIPRDLLRLSGTATFASPLRETSWLSPTILCWATTAAPSRSWIPNFTGQKGVNAIFLGSVDSNERRFVVEASGNAAYAAPGYLLFPREKTLLAQRFDLERLVVTGEPTAILTDIQYQPQVRRAVFAASDNGLLIAQTGSGVALSQPLWFDRRGKELGMVGTPDVYGNVSLASNGKSVAVDKTDMTSLNTDVWTYDLQRESSKRLTFDPAFDVVPIWSPDASRLIFASNRRLSVDLYMKNSDGAQEETAVVHDDFNKIPNDWFKDGKYILYTRGTDLWFLTLPELKSNSFLKAVSILRNGQFSPDGKWVAYASNETGKWEVYVTSFPDARGKWQVSVGGGEQPRWRGDGKELFYLSSDSRVIAVPVKTGPNFDNGKPIELFQITLRLPVSTNDQFVYAVTRDGQRFLILAQVKQGESQPMSVILNWPAKLNK